MSVISSSAARHAASAPDRLRSTPALRMAAATLLAGAALCAMPGLARAQAFTLWVTETPVGGSAAYNSQLAGGVRSYTFDGGGYTAGHYSVGPLIAASTLNDPSAVTVARNGDLLISNRGFNTGPGSVSRVVLNNNLPGAPTVALAGIATGPHQAAVTDAGGLVVSSFVNGGALYPGVATPSSVSFASGSQRGAVASGNLLYSTSGSSALQVYNLGSGAQVGSNFNVTGATLLHYGTLYGGSLYLADIGGPTNGAGGGVYKVTLDAAGNPVSSTRVASVDGAISVSFSPTGDEMFVAGHFNGFITGFAVSGGNVAATSNFAIDGGTLASWGGQHVGFGGMAVSVVPEPAPAALLLAGLAVLARLKRRQA